MHAFVRPIVLTPRLLSSLPIRLISKASPDRMKSHLPGYCHLPPSQVCRSISSIPFAIYILTPLSFVSPAQIPLHPSFVIPMVPIPLPAPFLHGRRRHASLPQFIIYHISYCRSRILGVHFPWSHFGKSACGNRADEYKCGWCVGSVGHIGRSPIFHRYLLLRSIFTLTILT